MEQFRSQCRVSGRIWHVIFIFSSTTSWTWAGVRVTDSILKCKPKGWGTYQQSRKAEELTSNPGFLQRLPATWLATSWWHVCKLHTPTSPMIVYLLRLRCKTLRRTDLKSQGQKNWNGICDWLGFPWLEGHSNQLLFPTPSSTPGKLHDLTEAIPDWGHCHTSDQQMVISHTLTYVQISTTAMAKTGHRSWNHIMITKYLSLREHLENYKIHWPRRRFLLEAMTDPDPFALLALRFLLGCNSTSLCFLSLPDPESLSGVSFSKIPFAVSLTPWLLLLALSLSFHQLKWEGLRQAGIENVLQVWVLFGHEVKTSPGPRQQIVHQHIRLGALDVELGQVIFCSPAKTVLPSTA